MIKELDLQKAKGSALASHFKKMASHHTKKAAFHEKCMKAHEGAQAHHEGMMGKAEDAMHGHHKAKAAFHKTMAGHHEKMHAHHTEMAEHHTAMASAHSADNATAKAAFAKLEVEVVDSPETQTAAPAAADTTSTGDTPVNKTTEPTAAVVDPAKTAATVVPPTTAAAAGDPTDIQKALKDGLQAAVANGIKEIIASPEFKKTMQEQIANALLEQLGQQTAAATVKTFAVPRAGTSVLDVAKALSTGTTPQLDTTGVAPEFAHFVGLGDD